MQIWLWPICSVADIDVIPQGQCNLRNAVMDKLNEEKLSTVSCIIRSDTVAKYFQPRLVTKQLVSNCFSVYTWWG